MSQQPIAHRIAEVTALLDVRTPGWAAKVPLDVNIADPAHSPLAYLLGEDWDTKITADSAIRMGCYTLYTAEAWRGNQVWKAQIAQRRTLRRAS